MTFTLSSPAFTANERIPARCTCDGADVSPPLAWSGAPAGMRSFALICTDPDAPSGTWYHWAVYDIAPEVTRLPEALPLEMEGRTRQAINDFYRPGYCGPCPPCGHGTHHYHFRLYALNVDALPVKAEAHSRDVERAARQHMLAETDLVGTYDRA